MLTAAVIATLVAAGPSRASTAPPLNIQPDAPSMCAGTSVTLDAGPGFGSYDWSTGETTQTITVSPLTTTVYSVTAGDGVGTFDDAETVTVHDNPTAVIAVPPSACSSDAPLSIPIDGSGSTSTVGIIDFRWSVTGGSLVPGPAPALTSLVLPPNFMGCIDIGLEVIDALGCTDTAVVTFCVVPSPWVVIACNPTLTCADPSLPVSVSCDGRGTVAAAPIVGWAWSLPPGALPGTSGPLADLTLPAGTTGCFGVSLTVFDQQGCLGSGSASFCVEPQPVAVAGPDRSGCIGSTVRLGAYAVPGFSYEWTPAGGLDRADVAQPVATLLTNVSYRLRVTSPAGGCADLDTVDLTVHEPRADPMVNGLRMHRAGIDVVCRWADRTGLESYRIEAGALPDLSDAVPLGEVGAGVEVLSEPGAAAGAGARHFRLVAYDCPP